MNTTAQNLALQGFYEKSPFIMQTSGYLKIQNFFVSHSFSSFLHSYSSHTLTNTKLYNFLSTICILDGRKVQNTDANYSKVCFKNSHTTENGAGIFVTKCNLNLTQCLLYNLTTTAFGGALYGDQAGLFLDCDQFELCDSSTASYTGGNAIYLTKSVHKIKRSYAVRCYIDRIEGESVFFFHFSDGTIDFVNFSKSQDDGEGEALTFTADTKRAEQSFCQIVDCYFGFSIATVGSSTVPSMCTKFNIVRNELRNGILCAHCPLILSNSCLFGNTNYRYREYPTVINCIGDYKATNVTYETYGKTLAIHVTCSSMKFTRNNHKLNIKLRLAFFQFIE